MHTHRGTMQTGTRIGRAPVCPFCHPPLCHLSKASQKPPFGTTLAEEPVSSERTDTLFHQGSSKGRFSTSVHVCVLDEQHCPTPSAPTGTKPCSRTARHDIDKGARCIRQNRNSKTHAHARTHMRTHARTHIQRERGEGLQHRKALGACNTRADTRTT